MRYVAQICAGAPKELLEFLDADVDVKSLEDQHAQTQEALAELAEAQEQLQAGLLLRNPL